MSNDYLKGNLLRHTRAEGYYRRDASLGKVDGAWKTFVQGNKDRDALTMDQEPRNMYSGGGLARALMLLKNFNKTGAVKGLEEKLIKQYKSQGMEFLDAIKKAQTEAGGVRYQGKIKIINDAMKETNVMSDDYVDLLDMKIKIEDPDFAKQYVKFSENLKNKTRSRHDSDWAEANFGEEYGTKLDQVRVREINESIDPNITERSLVDDIDDMNIANTDEFFGRKKNADGGFQQLVSNTVDGSRPGYAGVKGQDRGAVQNLYDQFGKNIINKLSREKFGKNFDKVEGGRGANARNNFVARIKEKGPLSLKELQLAGRDLQVKNRLGIQLDILEDLKKGPVTVEALAKKYKVSQKVIKEKGTLLLKNIYNKNVQMGKGVERGGRWLPDDDVTIDKILNNISKSPKLAVIQKDQIGRLFYDAFGREKLSNGKKNPTYNSKKYTAILKNLNEYNNIKKIISDKYPNIKLELDHPLSKSTLRKVFNASVDELVAVNPLERSLNQGFKKSLSDNYEKAITGEGNIKQKKAIEKIAKDLNINIGNVSNDFSKYKTGTKSFEKLNIKDEVLKSMQTQADLNSNLKGYVKQNPDLFKTANVNPNTNITKVTQRQVKGIVKKLNEAGFTCSLANGVDCDDPRSYAKSIKENMAKASQGDKSAVSNIKKMGKLMNGFKGAAKFTGWGLLGEIGFAAPLAALDYAKGANTDEIISNASYGLLGKSEDEQLREKYSDYGQAQDLLDTYNKSISQGEDLQDQTGYDPIVNQQDLKNTENKLEKQSKEFSEVLPPSMGFKGDFDLNNFFRREEIDNQRIMKQAQEKKQRELDRDILTKSTGLEAVGLADGGLANLMKKYYD